MLDSIFLVSISGDDRPGLMTDLCAALSVHNAEILDIGQAIIHSELALGLLVRVSEDVDRAALETSISPFKNFLNPPPVPDNPTVTLSLGNAS